MTSSPDTPTKAGENPTCWPIKPITDGASRMPEYPIIVTVLRPAPGDRPGWLPAAENAMGTILAMPKPERAKARMATQALGANPPTSMPVAATSAETRNVVTAPKRLRTASPAKRISAIVPEKAAKARPAVAMPAPSSCFR